MNSPAANTFLRSLPAMDDILKTAWASVFLQELGRNTVKKIIEEVLQEIRREILFGEKLSLSIDYLVESRAVKMLCLKSNSTLKTVVNATGVIIHTNLGRAPLPSTALQAVNEIAARYSTLEYDLQKGERGGRNTHIEWLIKQITGAEAALVVNNNAAAVLLSLCTIAADKEVILSAGELVEIGDSFRIPQILEFSGAKMRAVGCTNSTTISDYRNAINENTAVLLKVHPSNYRVEGFVKSASRHELSALAEEHSLVFMEDLGSGLLTNLNIPFANNEQTVRFCLEDGCHLVTFSGDKLLGGPQIGVIAGRQPLIEKMKHHQLLRALRVDKMTLAAFEANLRLYLNGKQSEIPVINMIETDKNALLQRAKRLGLTLKRMSDLNDFVIRVVETEDAIGGGSFPTDILKGYGVSVYSKTLSAEKIASLLRNAAVPVIAAIHDECVILHTRTLLEGDAKLIAAAFAVFK